jgi:hypothetical protein
MKMPKKDSQSRSVLESLRSFRAAVLVALLLTIGAVTAIAKYESSGHNPHSEATEAKQGAVANQSGNRFVTVAVAGKKLQVNALAMQQGPLTQEQAQQIADALKDNQSTDGLVQVRHADGTVSLDLDGRFQNVILAKKNDDGSISQACVDNSKAASAFLQSGDSTKLPGSGSGRKAPVKE